MKNSYEENHSKPLVQAVAIATSSEKERHARDLPETGEPIRSQLPEDGMAGCNTMIEQDVKLVTKLDNIGFVPNTRILLRDGKTLVTSE